MRKDRKAQDILRQYEASSRYSEPCKLCIEGISFPRSSIPTPVRWVPVRVRDRDTGTLVEKCAFEVSSEGQVRKKATKMLVPQHYYQSVGSGHVVISIDGVRVKVAHLVLWSFVGLPQVGQTDAAHWDDNRRNNRITNLRWSTRSENLKDRQFTRETNAPHVQHMRD